MSFFQPGDIIKVYFPFRDNPKKIKLRPALVVSIESVGLYKVCPFTGTNYSYICKGEWIEKNTDLGKSLGITKDCFLNLDNIMEISSNLIATGKIGEYPDIEELLDKHGIKL